MAVVVIGGHSRNVGKSSVVAGLIAALPEFNWTAIKISQHGHGICTAEGAARDCATADRSSINRSSVNRSSADRSWAVSEERDRSGESDTSRFLLAGAGRALWVRTEPGRLADAMPELRKRIAGAVNLIIESNSVLKFLRPDLYLTVLDPATADFKHSAQEFLDRADAVILQDTAGGLAWQSVSLQPVAGRPVFRITPPMYVTPEIADFVRSSLSPRVGRDKS